MSSYIQNPEEEVRDYLPRYRQLYAVVALSATLLLSGLWYLQIFQGERHRAQSEDNRIKQTKIPAPRGLILDREGRVLVDNKPGFSCTISPQYAKNLEETAQAVSTILDIPPKKIVQMVKTSRIKEGPFKPALIKPNLTLDEVFRLRTLRFDFPGLNVDETVLRHYPLDQNGAQTFGYVGEISEIQLGLYNEKFGDKVRFKQGDIIGKTGLEEVWELMIRGKDGLSFVEVDARGRQANAITPRYLGLTTIEPQPGNNIVLTIDKDLQEASYKALQRDDHIGPRNGSLIAMKTNGEVLAWISSPSFDPNDFSKQYAKLLNDPRRPLRNKVIQDHYAPGSSFKPIMALAALQEKIITPTTIVSAPGSLKFGRRVYHDSLKQGHGNITIYEAIERSSNIFFYKMGHALGIDRMHKYAKLFGYGDKTNIGLSNEVPGLMPSKEWKLQALGEEWQPGENLSNAIGQGFVLATAIQMALAYSVIGNEGKMYQPYIVEKVVSPELNILYENSPRLLRDISEPQDDGVFVAKANFTVVKEAMRRVANSDRGTAHWWKIPGIEMAGKTGTSQVMSFSADQIYSDCKGRPYTQRHHGWYIAFAPVQNPEIVVAVLTEHSCHGSTGSAPIVRDVIQTYMEKYHPEWVKKKEIAPALAQKSQSIKPEPKEEVFE